VYLLDLKTETQHNHELSQQLSCLKSKLKEITAKLKQLQKDHARLLDRKLEGDRRIGTLQQKLQQLKQQKGGSSGGGADGGMQQGWNQGFSSLSGAQGLGGGRDTATGAPSRRQQQQKQQQQREAIGFEGSLVGGGGGAAAAAGGCAEGMSAAMAAEQAARLAAEAKVGGALGADAVLPYLTTMHHIRLD
jgi:hypothetical protein